MVGAMYCNIPMIDKGINRAPEANKISGTAVATPANDNKTIVFNPVCPKAAVPCPSTNSKYKKGRNKHPGRF